MLVLLLVLGFMIGMATFIENAFDTTTARIEIFRSKSLEVILVLLAVLGPAAWPLAGFV